MQHFLVTGGAGFIGSNFIKHLINTQKNVKITCIDNFDPFYSREIKELNIASFRENQEVTFIEVDLSNVEAKQLATLIKEPVDVIVHLAAKAGVRPSIETPASYQKNNIMGLQHLIDFARDQKVTQFIFASSSSVYGVNEHFPWKETEPLLPISPYAMTKLTGEMLGHVYHKLYDIRFIALRFFTVYGPGQRPDLAIHKFTKKMINGEPIPMYGDGSTSRDYTFIDDVVSAIDTATRYDKTGFEIINIGNNHVVTLSKLIEVLGAILNKKPIIQQLPDQPGDLSKTYADITKAKMLLEYNPKTDLKQGLLQFVSWFKNNQSIL